MANTVKAYLNPNGNIIIDCGILYGKRIQYMVADTAVVQLQGRQIITDFSYMQEQYWDGMILSKLDNAQMLTRECRHLSGDEIDALIVLANEKTEDFDGPES